MGSGIDIPLSPSYRDELLQLINNRTLQRIAKKSGIQTLQANSFNSLVEETLHGIERIKMVPLLSLGVAVS